MPEIEAKKFCEWLKDNTKLSDSSIYKYLRAVISTSNEMLELKVVSKSLLDMNLLELDESIDIIFKLSLFSEKDKKGNRMYSNALKHYRYFIYSSNELVYDYKTDEKFVNDSTITVTQREAIIQSRIGQGIFRKRILNKYKNKCLITGLSITKCLIASHVKPWAVCTNEERLSENNGLLLSATYDRLFDGGLISFKNNGDIILSKFINENDKNILRLSDDVNILIGDNLELKQNLEYHRDIIFVK